MKKKAKLTTVLVGLALIFGLSAVAMAASQNVGVSGTISGQCRFTASSALAFTLDPNLGSDATATGSVTFWCTKSSAYTLSTDNGQNSSGSQKRLYDGSAVYINYAATLASTTGSGTGKTTPISVNINGTVVNADYVNQPAGSYTDTLAVTINP